MNQARQQAHADTIDFSDTTLEPLPWFPFTAGTSVGHGVAVAPVALAAERAYWALVRTWDARPRLTLLLLDAGDWQRHLPGRLRTAVQRVGADAWAIALDADPTAVERDLVEAIAPLFRTGITAVQRAA
jgi:hypothetical protein